MSCLELSCQSSNVNVEGYCKEHYLFVNWQDPGFKRLGKDNMSYLLFPVGLSWEMQDYIQRVNKANLFFLREECYYYPIDESPYSKNGLGFDCETILKNKIRLYSKINLKDKGYDCKFLYV